LGFADSGHGRVVATQEEDPRFHSRKVICISGDGGFGQYMGELLTAVQYDLNITHVLLRNDPLGMVSKKTTRWRLGGMGDEPRQPGLCRRRQTLRRQGAARGAPGPAWYCALHLRPGCSFAAGCLVSEHSLGLFEFDVTGSVVHALAELMLVVVLFTDVSRIGLSCLRREESLPIRLLGIGLPLTIVVGTVAGVALLPGSAGSRWHWWRRSWRPPTPHWGRRWPATRWCPCASARPST
jgi:hypothetical protein